MKDAHGLQRNKLLLGFAWVKYVLVEWHLYFRIMGPDQFLTRITGVFGHIHMSTVRNSLTVIYCPTVWEPSITSFISLEC